MSTQTLSPLISADTLYQKLNDAKLIILDARFNLMNENYGDEVYAQNRIPQALRVDLGIDLCTDITPDTGRHPLKSRENLEALMQDLGVNHDSHIVVYDDNGGMFAIHLWWVLHWLGHEKVQVLEGGLQAWQKAGYELEITAPQVNQMQGDFVAKMSEFSTVTADDILEDIISNQGKLCVVDARGAARYHGDVEPLDPVAGHIPNAINRPFELNLKEDGTFKDPEMLKTEWMAFLDGYCHQTIIHQCGSGVSACHNIFAMYYAGLGIQKLYPGSWSEWCKSPTRPVAKE
ncbi:sulfurtransferase [Wohlfahrtiimonas larvae]|uniref:Sulfurtransferase n=1 Tax=Wohlfahrtiimonas larvae TaxID=1157986 RepID=A0ABP9ML03_9GAMM|nr:sulfurtransferase [Wohlfahrtiimonas larvae]